MLKPYAVLDTTPDEVRDETQLPPKGEVRYSLTLSDEQVELLSQGIVPEAVSRRAFAMLEWKRNNARMDARARNAQ